MVKERFDRYLVSANWLRKVPPLATTILRQANSDHDLIILDTIGRKPRKGRVDPRLGFCFKECWTHDRDAKEIIKVA